jgi:hypothetical protein
MILMRLKGLFLLLAFLLAYPVEVLAADFNWTLTWQGGEMLTETIVTDNQDLINREGDWQQDQEQPQSFTRQTEGWAAYHLNPDRLPVAARTKNYLVIKITRIEPDAAAYGEGSTFYRLTESGSGQVRMEMPGLIMQAPQAEKSTWREGFAGTFSIAPQAQAEGYNLAMTVITIEIVPSVIAVLVVGWGLIWILYRRQVKRMEGLIEARYSLDNVITEMPAEMPAEENQNQAAEENKNP